VTRAELRGQLVQPALARHGFAALVRRFAAEDAALDAPVLALAPDWDGRLGRLLGFVNNDITRQRPTVAQLQLLDIDPVTVLPDLLAIDRGPAPLSARAVAAPEHVVRLSRSPLPAPAAWPSWPDLHMADAAKAHLRLALARELERCGRDRRLVLLEGLPGSGR